MACLKNFIFVLAKKANFQEINVDIQSLTEQNETNSMQDLTEETNVLRTMFTTSMQSFEVAEAYDEICN